MRILSAGQTGESPLHHFDPRVKVVTALLLIMSIVITPENAWLAYCWLWIVLVVLACVAKVGVISLARRGTLALPFALAASTLLFTLPGRPIFSVLGLTVSDTGLVRFISIVLKSWLAVQAAQLLALTTAFTDLLWAFRSLRVPSTIVVIISFMYRYLFTLQGEAQSLLRARVSRSGTLNGQRSGGGLLWRTQVAGGMVGNLFLRSYERSERVYAAMLARGYDGSLKTIMPPPLPRRDIVYATLFAIVLALTQVAAVLWL